MSEERYVLATGAEGDYRLQIVNSVHGPDSILLLSRAGLKSGKRVADIGCGVGIMSCWMAGRVGETGEVVGVDVSAGQIEQARNRAAKAAIGNARFVNTGAYETGLDRESFDIVYSRFLLMHLRQPAEAIAEMQAILKPGGTLVLEDGDFASPFCYPPSAAYDRCFELYRRAGERQGADFHVGPKLYNMAQDAGFRDIRVTLAQPVFTHGAAKRLPEWTLEECAPALLEAKITTQNEIDAVIAELQTLAADDRTQFGMARMTQIIAKK